MDTPTRDFFDGIKQDTEPMAIVAAKLPPISWVIFGVWLTATFAVRLLDWMHARRSMRRVTDRDYADFRWGDPAPTPKQFKYARSLGIEMTNGATSYEVSAAIDRHESLREHAAPNELQEIRRLRGRLPEGKVINRATARDIIHALQLVEHDCPACGRPVEVEEPYCEWCEKRVPISPVGITFKPDGGFTLNRPRRRRPRKRASSPLAGCLVSIIALGLVAWAGYRVSRSGQSTPHRPTPSTPTPLATNQPGGAGTDNGDVSAGDTADPFESAADAPPGADPLERWGAHEWTTPLGNAGMRFRIIDIQIARPVMGDVGSSRVSDEAGEYLAVIRLAIESIDDRSLPEYRTWRRRQVLTADNGVVYTPASHAATLVDDLGNEYDQSVLNWDEQWFTMSDGGIPAVTGPQSIYPDSMVEDVLVFQRPLDAAEHLILTLPAATQGGGFDLVYHIPVADIIDQREGRGSGAAPVVNRPGRARPSSRVEARAAWRDPVEIGRASVEILGARAGAVSIQSDGLLKTSDGAFLTIPIRVRNLSDEPMVYRSWSSVGTGATLEAGDRVIPRASVQASVFGRADRTVLGPGQAVDDVLVFEVPDGDRGHTMTLTLSPQIVGGDRGDADGVFEIDLDDIEWQPGSG